MAKMGGLDPGPEVWLAESGVYGRLCDATAIELRRAVRRTTAEPESALIGSPRRSIFNYQLSLIGSVASSGVGLGGFSGCWRELDSLDPVSSDHTTLSEECRNAGDK